MATIGVEMVMDRVSLTFDCETKDEAKEIYNMLASQILDGKTIKLNMTQSIEKETK